MELCSITTTKSYTWLGSMIWGKARHNHSLAVHMPYANKWITHGAGQHHKYKETVCLLLSLVFCLTVGWNRRLPWKCASSRSCTVSQIQSSVKNTKKLSVAYLTFFGCLLLLKGFYPENVHVFCVSLLKSDSFQPFVSGRKETIIKINTTNKH